MDEKFNITTLNNQEIEIFTEEKISNGNIKIEKHFQINDIIFYFNIYLSKELMRTPNFSKENYIKIETYTNIKTIEKYLMWISCTYKVHTNKLFEKFKQEYYYKEEEINNEICDRLFLIILSTNSQKYNDIYNLLSEQKIYG